MKLKLMSYNVLCGGPEGMTWPERKDLVIDNIRSYMPDSFGVQEAHYDWMQTLSAALPEYEYVGVGRDDGKLDGEFSAVFYLKDKFSLIDSDTFWLSETPDVPSRGWDSSCTRVCSWARLAVKGADVEFVHMNTHLDHRGPVARKDGLDLILKKAQEFTVPVVLTGDFNFDQGCDLYETMTSGSFKDTKFAAKETMDHVTFNAFYPLRGKAENQAVIDFINVTKEVNVLKYKVVTDRPGGLFPSDHDPVYAEIEL